jgi:hypothetical protein
MAVTRSTSAVFLSLMVACSGGGGSDGGMDSGSTDDAQMPVDSPPGDRPVMPECNGPPGLYVDGSCTVLRPGVRPFHPQYVLWSDGADKERFVFLPPGRVIDTSNPDRWSFPAGTTFFKTFSRAGVRLETRILRKLAEDPGETNWEMVAYAWSADQLSVQLVEAEGRENVLGTDHDIPSQANCVRCHVLGDGRMGMLDVINGFSAIQLNHDTGGVTLQTLLEEDLLENILSGTDNITLANSTIPGDATAQIALGYLHANCGHCHATTAAQPILSPPRGFSVPVGTGRVADLPIWSTSVCVCSNAGFGVYPLEISPAHPEMSLLVGRMSVRPSGLGGISQMPPIGTEHIDPAGMAAVSAWITSLNGNDAAMPGDCIDGVNADCPPMM